MKHHHPAAARAELTDRCAPAASSSAAARLGGRRRCAALLGLAALLPPLLSTPLAAQIELELTRLDGTQLRGALREASPQIVLETAEGEAAFGWSEVQSVRPLRGASEPTVPPSGQPLRVELVDGSCFAATLLRASEQHVLLRTAANVELRIELSLLKAIYSASANADILRKLNALTRAAPESDLVVVARGEEMIPLSGVIRRLDAKQVTVLWKEREVSPSWERIALLRFAARMERGASCLVHTLSGDVFAGRVSGARDSTILLRSSVLDDLPLEWAQILRIECRSERVVPLATLTPLQHEFEPFLEREWSPSFDKSLYGRPISLAGRTFASGVCQHSQSRLTYRLNGGFRQFAASVGISDDVAPRGDARVAILGDGRVLWRIESLRGGEPAREVAIELQEVNELTLLVEFGDGLDLADHVCWGYARLIRS